MRPYRDLLLVAALLGLRTPPAGLPALGRLLLLRRAALGLPLALGRLPLRGGLPAGSATSLRRHVCSMLAFYFCEKGEIRRGERTTT